MKKEKYQVLYKLWLEGRMTNQEWAWFRDAVIDRQNDAVLDELIDADLANNEFDKILSAEDLNRAYHAILDRAERKPLETKVDHLFTNVRMWQLAAVAAVFILMTISLYIYYSGPRLEKSKPLSIANQILPGGNKATLTLADGKTITLSSDQNGVSITAGKISYNDGSLLKEVGTTGLTNDLMEIHTPRGGQYALTLPDGSKIWLNAASTLKFPKSFAGHSARVVELAGEAYLEVAKNREQPFKVKTAGQEVEVLGTHFNVNAYSDEVNIKTTLLEGRVKINNAVILRPGEEAVLAAGRIDVHQVSASEAVAWKNGEFMFNDEQLGVIMRKIGRWYDLEIQYQDEKIQTQLFGGTITKFGNVSDVLRMLELTGGVHFKIEGRRIIVIK